MTGPYTRAYDEYRAAGWTGTIPLPARQKWPPPQGYTGENGMWPSYADCHTWATGPEGEGNIALRLPHNILGIDVDAYATKQGADTLTDAEHHWGPLPTTWRSSSRSDGISGIRLYRVTEGLAWPGELGPGVELIQHTHRYAVVAPSVHPEGGLYRWIAPDGAQTSAVPDPDHLPPLPPTWVEGLTSGALANPAERNNLDTHGTRVWILTRKGATEPPCARMAHARDLTLNELTQGQPPHPSARDGALRTIRLSDENHPGAVAALTAIRAAFTNVATTTRPGGNLRTPRQAETEWQNLVTSAVNLVTANPTGVDTCDCAGALTGLIVDGAYPQTRPAPLDDVPGEVTDIVEDKPRTSWWPKDLAAVIEGRHEEPPPEHLQRSDGACAFYPGKINGILGESESGKTWIALLAAHQATRRGEHVLYIDFEDTVIGIIGRLRNLGAVVDDLNYFHYIGPEETLTAAASGDLREALDTITPILVIVDGVNSAMTLMGKDLDKNKDVTEFSQLLLRPLAKTGATIVTVDHVPKHKETRAKGGIGAQAKRADITGCCLTAEISEPFGKGTTGSIRLVVDKDRSGYVREHSQFAKYFGTAVVEPRPGGVVIRIEVPEHTSWVDLEGASKNTSRVDLRDRILVFLEQRQGWASQTAIEENVKGNAQSLRNTASAMSGEGVVERMEDQSGSIMYRYVSPPSTPSFTPSSKDGTGWKDPVPDPRPPGELRSSGSPGRGRGGGRFAETDSPTPVLSSDEDGVDITLWGYEMPNADQEDSTNDLG